MQTAALRNLHRCKRFHHIIHRFHAGKEIFQLGEWQSRCAVAFGLAGVGVAFQKQACQACCHACQREV